MSIRLGVLTLKGRYIVLLLSGLLLQISAAHAELKIGFVDVPRILDNSPQAELASKRLEQEFAPRQRSLVDAQKSLRRLEEKLVTDGDVMSESQRRNLERDIINQKRELKRSQDEFREDLNIRRNEELSKLQRQIHEAIVGLARQERYDLVLTQGVIHVSEQINITDKVLNRLQ